MPINCRFDEAKVAPNTKDTILQVIVWNITNKASSLTLHITNRKA